MRWRSFLMALAGALIATSASAVQPDEILSDPVLEARAREITKEVRCLVCRNESVDDSSAGLAKDLRLLVRERLVAGDSNSEVKDFLVARFGEFVLLRPPFNAGNLVLWFAGPVMFLGGIAGAFWFLRGRKRAQTGREAPLSDDEKAEIERLLRG